MTNLLTFTAALLVIACFLAVIVLGKAANEARQERKAWMMGFYHLWDAPGDIRGGLEVVNQYSKANNKALQGAKVFHELLKKGK